MRQLVVDQASQPLRNRAIDPRTTKWATTAPIAPGASNERWNNVTTYTLVTGAADVPNGITTYARASFTSDTQGGLGFHLADNPEAGSPTAVRMITVVPGQQVSVSVWARSSIATSSLSTKYRWAAGTTWVTGASSPTVTVIAGAWQMVSLSLVAPAGATHLALALMHNVAVPIGTTLDVTGMMIVDGPLPSDYRDGNSLGWRWTGTANASASVGYPRPAAEVVNLVRNPSFEVDAVGIEWQSARTPPWYLTVSYQSSWLRAGTRALQLMPLGGSGNVIGGANDTYVQYGGFNNFDLQLKPNTTYTAFCQVRTVVPGSGTTAGNGNRQITAWIHNGTGYTTYKGTQVANTAGATARSVVTFTTPAVIKESFIRLYSGYADGVMQFDDVMLVEGADPGFYADGSFQGWNWLGTPHRSVSYGMPDTLAAAAGGAPLATVTTPGASSAPLGLTAFEGRTLYLVADALALEAPAGMVNLATIGPTVSAAPGRLLLRASFGAYASRADAVSGGGAVAATAPASRPRGRHVVVATLNDGGTSLSVLSDSGTILTASIQAGTGQHIDANNLLVLGAATTTDAPVVAIAFRGEHDTDTRRRVIDYLKRAYPAPDTLELIAGTPDVTMPSIVGATQAATLTGVGATEGRTLYVVHDVLTNDNTNPVMARFGSDVAGIVRARHLLTGGQHAQWDMFRADNSNIGGVQQFGVRAYGRHVSAMALTEGVTQLIGTINGGADNVVNIPGGDQSMPAAGVYAHVTADDAAVYLIAYRGYHDAVTRAKISAWLKQQFQTGYTLQSVGGTPLVSIVGTGVSAFTLATVPPLAGRTTYVVSDRAANPTPTQAVFVNTIQSTTNQTGQIRLHATLGTYEFRPQFNGGGGSGGVYASALSTVPAAGTRNTLVAAQTEGLTQFDFELNGGLVVADRATRTGMVPGTGYDENATPGPNAGPAVIAGFSETPVVTFQFLDYHDQETRRRVTAWLARRYGAVIPAGY